MLNLSNSFGTQNITQLQNLQTQINQIARNFSSIKDSTSIKWYEGEIEKNFRDSDGTTIKLAICDFNKSFSDSSCELKSDLNDVNDPGQKKRKFIESS